MMSHDFKSIFLPYTHFIHKNTISQQALQELFLLKIYAKWQKTNVFDQKILLFIQILPSQ